MLNTGETFAEGMTSGQIGKKVTYELLTDKDAYNGGSSKTTKMIWTGEVCDDKIKWNSMKSLLELLGQQRKRMCVKRESNSASWQTTYLGGCGQLLLNYIR